MNAHLAKPLQIKKVKQTIAEWVKNNRTGKKGRVKRPFSFYR